MSAEPDRRRRLLQMAAGAAFLALAAVLVLIVVNATKSGDGGDTKIEGVAEVDRLLDGIPQEGLFLGDYKKGVPVELIEYGDLQCPVCKGYAEEKLPPIIEHQVRQGEAAIEFRNFAIIGPQSKPAGAAAIAAGEQHRGWNFLELFFRNQGEENSGYADDAFLKAVARAAGVKNMKKWNSDRAKLTGYVESTTQRAESLGFEGTPTFATAHPTSPELNVLESLPSTSELEEAIEEAAKEANAG